MSRFGFVLFGSSHGILTATKKAPVMGPFHVYLSELLSEVQDGLKYAAADGARLV